MDNIQVIIERIANLKEDNAQEHKFIIDRLDNINGSVAGIQQWRWILTGAIIIMNVFLVPIVLAVAINYLIK